MEQKIFRKKSLDKINSPESLNDYIRVSNPGVWLILGAVIALLIGVVVWGIFGSVDSAVNAYAVVSDGEAVCYVSKDDIACVEKGTIVILDGKESNVCKIGSFNEEKNSYEVYAETKAADGSYSAELVIERVRPVSFVLN